MVTKFVYTEFLCIIIFLLSPELFREMGKLREMLELNKMGNGKWTNSNAKMKETCELENYFT